MSLIDTYIEFTKRWEGGLSRATTDTASKNPCPTAYGGKTGWHTNIGITYPVWVSVFGKSNDTRFFEMNHADWFNVFKTLYWNSMRASEYNSMNVAIIITGMAWGSGKKQAILSLQQAILDCHIKVEKDGILGNATIAAVNSIPPQIMFDAIANERERFFRYIGRPCTKNSVNLKGWLNRLADYKKTFRP